MPCDAQRTIGPMDGYLDDFPGERNYMRINHPGLFTAEDGEVVEENRPHSKRDFVAALDEEERPNDVQPNQQPLPTSVAQFGQHRERPAPHSPLTPTRGVSPLPSRSPKRVLSPLPTAQDGRQPQSPRRSATPPTVPRPRRGKGSPADALAVQGSPRADLAIRLERVDIRGTDAEAKLAGLQADYDALKEKNKADVKSRDDKIERLEFDVARLSDEQSLNHQVRELQADVARCGGLKARNADLATQNRELTARNDELTAQNGALETRNAEQEKEKADLRGESARLRADYDKLQAKIAEIHTFTAPPK